MNIQERIKQHVGERLYPIGFHFLHKQGRKAAKRKEVLNYHISFNYAGNVVNFGYILAYDFCGQRMTEEVPQATIDRATNNGWKELNKVES